MSDTSEPTRQVKVFNRPVSQREAVEAFKRLHFVRQGQPEVIRFWLGQRIEHLLLLVSFGGLALTGLAQTFDNFVLGRQLLLSLGGLESAQRVHHLFALVLGALSIYHALNILDSVFVRRQISKLLPEKSDSQFLTLNKLPLFDRYSFDEKFVYWVVFFSVGILGLTGLSLWFPTWVTLVLPGSYFQYATAIHRWQAIFAVTVLVLLHTYQVLLRKRNFSIFTGRISLEDMQEDHPAELAYLEKVSEQVQTGVLPKTIEFTVEERIPRKVYVYVEPEHAEEDDEEYKALVRAAKEKDQKKAAGRKTKQPVADGEAAK
jgi:cytochrome b subunit of formate dehydrogenase